MAVTTHHAGLGPEEDGMSGQQVQEHEGKTEKSAATPPNQQQEPEPSRDATLCARYFANHRAEYHRAELGGATVELLTWKQPGTFFNRVDYVCLNGGRLLVSGDLGDAIYSTGAKELAWWTRCDLSYFAGKCDASEQGRGYMTWDDDKALERFRVAVAREREDGEDVDEELVADGEDAIRGGRADWEDWMRNRAHELFGDDWWDFVPNFGRVVDTRCALHLIGLKAALAQLAEPADVAR